METKVKFHSAVDNLHFSSVCYFFDITPLTPLPRKEPCLRIELFSHVLDEELCQQAANHLRLLLVGNVCGLRDYLSSLSLLLPFLIYNNYLLALVHLRFIRRFLTFIWSLPE